MNILVDSIGNGAAGEDGTTVWHLDLVEPHPMLDFPMDLANLQSTTATGGLNDFHVDCTQVLCWRRVRTVGRTCNRGTYVSNTIQCTCHIRVVASVNGNDPAGSLMVSLYGIPTSLMEACFQCAKYWHANGHFDTNPCFPDRTDAKAKLTLLASSSVEVVAIKTAPHHHLTLMIPLLPAACAREASIPTDSDVRVMFATLEETIDVTPIVRPLYMAALTLCDHRVLMPVNEALMDDSAIATGAPSTLLIGKCVVYTVAAAAAAAAIGPHLSSTPTAGTASHPPRRSDPLEEAACTCTPTPIAPTEKIGYRNTSEVDRCQTAVPARTSALAGDIAAHRWMPARFAKLLRFLPRALLWYCSMAALSSAVGVMGVTQDPTAAPTHTPGADIAIATFTSGTEGFLVGGGNATDRAGWSVSRIGDINGDGIDDVAIGSPFADPLGRTDAGQVMVIYGHSAATTFDEVDPNTYNFGSGGFIVYGSAAGDQAGYSMASAGDVNGDGSNDMIIGAQEADFGGQNQAGAAYVIFGRQSSNPFPASIDLLNLFAGSEGFKIFGSIGGHYVGGAVSGAGDVNGDGYDDVIIAQIFPKTTSIVFGFRSDTAFTDIDADTFTSGTEGFRLNGVIAYYFGQSVSGAGDVNGDGFDDVIIGAFQETSEAGISYVIFGHSGAFADIDLLTFTAGATGFRILGAEASSRSGWSVSGAGDVNSDGYDDVVVGARWADYSGRSDAGAAYVIFGHSTGTAFTDIDLSTMVYGTLGFRVYGAIAGDNLGGSVSSAGDVNGDGIKDIVVGSMNADIQGVQRCGAVVVVYGHSNKTTFADIDAANSLGSFGYRVCSAGLTEDLGYSVAAAGDVNNDGISDLFVGAPSTDYKGRQDAGGSYVLFGAAPLPTAQPTQSPMQLPTVVPTRSPTRDPTISPSNNPTHRPTPTPSADPTISNTAVPTRNPSLSPTCSPTVNPSRSPTVNPTQNPSQDPTFNPSATPTRSPTLNPTRNPTIATTARPSAVPTTPTASPTISSCPPGTRYANANQTHVCIDCPAGRYSNTYGGAAECSKCAIGEYAENPRSTQCEKCPQGSYADAEETVTCSSCRAGTYQDVTGGTSISVCKLCDAGSTSAERASSCSLCPTGSHASSAGSASCSDCAVGTYADIEGTADCTNCAAGTYTDFNGTQLCTACPLSSYSAAEGATSALTCTPCPANRITSVVGSTRLAECLNPAANFAQGALALVVAFIVSVVYIFLGRMNAVAYGRMRYIQRAGESYTALIKSIHCVEQRKVVETRTALTRAILFWGFVVGAALLFAGIVALLAVTSFGRIFFSSMIMFRNVHMSLPNVNFVDRVEHALQNLDVLLGFNVSYAFGWIFYIFDALASININLDFANVTCLGSQAPIVLLINIMLFIAIVILIECDVAAFLESTFSKAHNDFRKVVLNGRARDIVDFEARKRRQLWLMSFAECSVLNAATVVYVLQYSLSLLSVGEFFTYYGRHRSSPTCDDISGVPGIDTALAISSSVLLYVLLPAVLYNIAKLLAPRLVSYEKYESSKQGFSHRKTIAFIDKHPVTLKYSPVPPPDCFVSWRFGWAHKVLQTRKNAKPDELMFTPPDGVKVDKPVGLGLCPLVSATTDEFQDDWKAECQERLPEYGLFLSRSMIIYARVLWLNVWTYICVIAGYWNPDSTDKFDLLRSIRVSGIDSPQDVRISRSVSSVSVLLSFCKLLYRMVTCGGSAFAEGKYTVPEDGGESRILVSKMISAKLSTRAVLCLLFPFGGLITTYVSYTSAYPIFCCQDKSLNRSLPGLIVFDSYLLAEKRVRKEGSYAKWKVQFMSWYIFVTESRLLNYWYNFMLYLMSVSILFYPVEKFLMFGAVVILAYCMVCALFPIVVLGNMLGVHDDEQHDASTHPDGADNEYSEKDYDNGDYDEERCIEAQMSTVQDPGESERTMLDTPLPDTPLSLVPVEESPFYYKSADGDASSRNNDGSDDAVSHGEVHTGKFQYSPCATEKDTGAALGVDAVDVEVGLAVEAALAVDCDSEGEASPQHEAFVHPELPSTGDDAPEEGGVGFTPEASEQGAVDQQGESGGTESHSQGPSDALGTAD